VRDDCVTRGLANYGPGDKHALAPVYRQFSGTQTHLSIYTLSDAVFVLQTYTRVCVVQSQQYLPSSTLQRKFVTPVLDDSIKKKKI